MHSLKLIRNLFAVIVLMALACVTLSSAATVKRPLSPAFKNGIYHFTWSGSAPVVTADALVFMADTTAANVYGLDPSYYIQKKKIGLTAEDKVFPGEKAPEKLCVSLKVAGDGDATTSDVYISTATSKDGTFVKLGGTAQTHTSTVSSTVAENIAVPINPFEFWKLTVDPTTTTDSIEVVGADVWPCDD